MYTPKFEYLKFSRVDTPEGRRYVTPDGERLPSVTTILDATKSEESKKALHEWRMRKGAKQAQEITTEAANRGTRMHKWLEGFVINGDIGTPGSNPYSKQSHTMAQIIVDNGLVNCDEFWGSEIPLYFPKVYAGTTDLVGVHNGSPAIMDFKQANKLKKREWISDYFVQLAAYAAAHNEVYGTSISKGVVFMCTADYQYQEFIVEGKEFEHWTSEWFKKLEQYYTKLL